MNLNLNFNGKTLLRDWWKIVSDNFTTIQSIFNTHQTAEELDHPDKSVKQRHIADKAVGTNQIADTGVTSAKIAPNAVTAEKISSAAVQAKHIKDGDVTKAKLEQSIKDFIDSEPTIRATAVSELHNKIKDIATQSNIYDLYGDKSIIHTATLEVYWLEGNDTIYDSTSNAYADVDLSQIIGDITFVIDDDEIYNTAIPDSSWNVDYTVRVNEFTNGDYVLMNVDTENAKIWCSTTTDEWTGPKYENGIFVFKIGLIEADFYYADDGSGVYEVTVNLIRYNTSLNNLRQAVNYDGVRTITQLKDFDNFLDAVNKHTENIAEIESCITLTAHDTASLSAALNSIRQTGGTVILTGDATVPTIAQTNGKQYIIEGVNRNVVLTHNLSSFGAGGGTIIFRNLTVHFATKRNANYVFENCKVVQHDAESLCDNSLTNLTFSKSAIEFLYQYDSVAVQAAIKSAKNVIVDNACEVCINSLDSDIESAGDREFHFIYSCQYARISNSSIKLQGERLPGSLFGQGVYIVTNNDLDIGDDGNSLFRPGIPENLKNILSNNQIFINGGTYLNSGTISDNTFNIGTEQDGSTYKHYYYNIKMTGSAKITDNIFLGNSAYIDCDNHVCIIKDNMSQETLVTVNTATSIIKDNVQEI